ncbi:protein kinase activity protein [[Candida] boidinii]|nr:protein kinase activity protein [[Candida] boidinii]OWB84447.1 protein kinase activity protein [[Candida] boidinii]GMG02815.1 unnamed protein product [[Candida] boidinii]
MSDIDDSLDKIFDQVANKLSNFQLDSPISDRNIRKELKNTQFNNNINDDLDQPHLPSKSNSKSTYIGKSVSSYAISTPSSCKHYSNGLGGFHEDETGNNGNELDLMETSFDSIEHTPYKTTALTETPLIKPPNSSLKKTISKSQTSFNLSSTLDINKSSTLIHDHDLNSESCKKNIIDLNDLISSRKNSNFSSKIPKRSPNTIPMSASSPNLSRFTNNDNSTSPLSAISKNHSLAIQSSRLPVPKTHLINRKVRNTNDSVDVTPNLPPEKRRLFSENRNIGISSNNDNDSNKNNKKSSVYSRLVIESNTKKEMPPLRFISTLSSGNPKLSSATLASSDKSTLSAASSIQNTTKITGSKYQSTRKTSNPQRKISNPRSHFHNSQLTGAATHDTRDDKKESVPKYTNPEFQLPQTSSFKIPIMKPVHSVNKISMELGPIQNPSIASLKVTNHNSNNNNSNSLHANSDNISQTNDTNLPSYLKPTRSSLRKLSSADGKENTRSGSATLNSNSIRRRSANYTASYSNMDIQRNTSSQANHKLDSLNSTSVNTITVPHRDTSHSKSQRYSISNSNNKFRVSSLGSTSSGNSNSSSSFSSRIGSRDFKYPNNLSSSIENDLYPNSNHNNDHDYVYSSPSSMSSKPEIPSNNLNSSSSTFTAPLIVKKTRSSKPLSNAANVSQFTSTTLKGAIRHSSSTNKLSLNSSSGKCIDASILNQDQSKRVSVHRLSSAAKDNNSLKRRSIQNVAQLQRPVSQQHHYQGYDDFATRTGQISRDINNSVELYQRLMTHPATSKDMCLMENLFSEPLSPSEGIKPESLSAKRPDMFDSLSVYEKGEIIRKEEVYFTGLTKQIKKKVDITNFVENFGFDKKDKNYDAIVGDHINYRYEIKKILGSGAFGTVLACTDHKLGSLVSVKLIKNEMQWSFQAVHEVKILKKLNSHQNKSNENILRFMEHFHFRGHICIVAELLSVNLYQVIEATDFNGLSLRLVQNFSQQILKGLNFIHHSGIIHCDLKPENIMVQLRNDGSEEFIVKIIDFGSSCNEDSLSFSYLQSRFYRAPEVVIAARYNQKIDIWSFATVIVELYMGNPLFPATNEFQLISMILEHFGPPNKMLINKLRHELLSKGPIVNQKDIPKSSPYNTPSSNSTKQTHDGLLWRAFDKEGIVDFRYLRSKYPKSSFKSCTSTLERTIILQKKRKNERLFKQFLDVLHKCFLWDPSKRYSASELLSCQFFD